MITQVKIAFIDEKKIKIDYPGVEKKSNRPYLIANLDSKYKILVPITGMINEKGVKKAKRNDWVKIRVNKKSYIKFNEYLIFEKKVIKHAFKEEIIVFSKNSISLWKRIKINKFLRAIQKEQKEMRSKKGEKPIYDAIQAQQSRIKKEERQKSIDKIKKEIDKI